MKKIRLSTLEGVVLLFLPFFTAWADVPTPKGSPAPKLFTPTPTFTPLVMAKDDPPESTPAAPLPAEQVGPAIKIVQAAPEKRLVLKEGSCLWIKGATTKWSFELRASVLLGSAILKAPVVAAGGENALLEVVQKAGVQALNLVVPVDQLKTNDIKVASENYSLAGPHHALKGEDNPYVQFRLEDVTLGQEAKGGAYPLKASGKLTVAGVTKDIPLEAEATFSGTQVRVKGFYQLRLEDFKVKPRSDIWGPMNPGSVDVHFDLLFGPE